MWFMWAVRVAQLLNHFEPQNGRSGENDAGLSTDVAT